MEKNYKTSLNLLDKKNLNNILTNSLLQDGIPPEELPKHSQAGLLIQGMNTQFDMNLTTIHNIKRESSILNCQAMSSLYSQVIQHMNEIILSRPSEIELNVKIPTDYIKQYGTPLPGGIRQLVYLNSNYVTLDSLPFVCEHEKVYINVFDYDRDGVDDVRVFIMRDGVEVNLSFQRYHDFTLNRSFVLFDSVFRQITVETKYLTFTDAIMERFSVVTEEPIHAIFLNYISTNKTKRPVQPKLYFMRTTTDALEYKYITNRSIVIDHNYVPGGFKPEVNGDLEVICVTTTGRNIKFAGDPENAPNLTPNNLQVTYHPIKEEFYESKGGRLASDSKENIRNMVLKSKSTRKRIDTESDMRSYLLNYEGSSLFTPIMTINDVGSRLWSIFTTLSFSQDVSYASKRKFVVPTDSADVLMNLKKTTSWTSSSGDSYYSVNSSDTISSLQTVADPRGVFTLDKAGYVASDEGSHLFSFVTPFIHSFSDKNNYVRSYYDIQDNRSMKLYPEYELDVQNVETRFIATHFRISMDKDDYVIKMRVRADNHKCNLLENDKFRAVIKFRDMTDTSRYYTITTKTVTDIQDKNMYDVVFDAYTKRAIYGDVVLLSFTDVDGVKYVDIPVKNKPEKLQLLLQMREKNFETGEYGDTYNNISIMTCKSFSLFEEATHALSIQTSFDLNTGTPFFCSLPLVAASFYNQHINNRLNIYKEIANIKYYIDKETYTDLEAMSSRGYNLRDLQETLYHVGIRFVKSIGVSSKLQVSSDESVCLENLQLTPTFLIRKRVAEYDTAEISNAFSNALAKHVFGTEDLSMWTFVRDFMEGNSEYVHRLQFINFDSYQANFHTISQVSIDVGSKVDVPEVVSLATKYDEKLDLYEYDVSYVPN